MRRDRRDFSSARAKIGPLLAAGPWLRGGLVLNPRSRCESGAETGDCRRGRWIHKPDRRPQLAGRPIDRAINSEASVIIFHDGWYYLLVTDGACCAGPNSSCDIRIGRSRKVTGPFVDNMGTDLLESRRTAAGIFAIV